MSRPVALSVNRKPKKTGRKGGQRGNTNALKHGVWANIHRRNLDGRTALAKSLAAAETGLVEAIGGNPTPQQLLIIQRAIYKSYRCGLFETASLNGESDDHSHDSDAFYLAWSNSMRLDLAALGLEGIQGPPSADDAPLIRVVFVDPVNGETLTRSELQPVAEPQAAASPRPERQRPAEPEQPVVEHSDPEPEPEPAVEPSEPAEVKHPSTYVGPSFGRTYSSDDNFHVIGSWRP